MTRLLFAVAMLWTLGAADARAQQPSSTLAPAPEDGAPPPRRRKGTYRLLELSAGITPSQAPRFAGGLTLGAGGRPAGSPLRFYLITEANYGKWFARGDGSRPADLRKHYSLGAGLRIYLPLVSGLRVFADATLGASYLTSELQRSERTLRASGWALSGGLSAGLQYRLARAISVGLRSRWWLSDDPLSALQPQLGARRFTPMSLSGTLTWHF